MSVPSFNIVGLTVPEKSVMKIIFLSVTESQNDNHRNDKMTESYNDRVAEWWKDMANPVIGPFFKDGWIDNSCPKN